MLRRGPGLGHRRQQRPLLAHRRRAGARTVVAIDADQGPRRAALPRAARRGRRADPAADDEPRRPVARPRLARPRAQALPDRGRPDLVLALALVHHLAIAANVPVKEFVDWLAGLGAALVIEFPTREDPMVKKLLAPKREGLHPDYELGFFERCLGEAFDDRALRAARVGHARALPRSPQAGDERHGAGRRRGGPARRRAERRAVALRCTWPSCGPSRVAQPLFDLLQDNPEFFAARGSLGLRHHQLLGPPGGAAARAAARRSSCCSGLIGRRCAPRRCTWSSSRALAALIAAQALKKSIDVAGRRADRACRSPIGLRRGRRSTRARSRCARS